MDEKIETKTTVLIVNFNSADFVGISLYSLSKLTKFPYQVFILDNGSAMEDYLRLRQYGARYDNVVLERRETTLRGSVAHGTALNYLVTKIATPYFSILDADAIWLMKNWDEILMVRINNQVKAVGTRSSPPKRQDFPLMYAIFFETETFKKLNINFCPSGRAILEDTGYELGDKYIAAGYQGENIDFKNTRWYKDGPFREVCVVEHYLAGFPHIFACHFARGSSLGAIKYKTGFRKYFYQIPYIGNYLVTRKGRREKYRWIDICQRIIDEQV